MSNGYFWGADGEVRVRGEFTAEPGQSAEVVLDGAIIDDPRMTVDHTVLGVTVTSISGDPAKDVAASVPISLHGHLDSGELVSLLSAQNRGLWKPYYVAIMAVFGAHVSDDQLYSAIRFRIDVARWTSHLADGENCAISDDGSVLRVTIPEDGTGEGVWLVYESARPCSRRDLDIRILASCRALARLAFDRPLAIHTIEVRISQNSEWLPLHSAAYSQPVSGYGESLLSREELTVERLANWITLNSRLDGLASGVYELGKGTVQSQVLIGTSLVEGVHRRLPYEQSQFPEASHRACDRIRKVARNAVAKAAEAEKGLDPERVRAAVRDAICHFEDIGYRARAQDVIDEVVCAVPELTESIPDLAGKLMAVRNDIAHHLTANDERESFSDRIDRWMMISLVTPWLLRLLLLLRVGVSIQALAF